MMIPEPDDRDIEALVAMLDGLAEQGSGHMNVISETQEDSEGLTVKSYVSTDCGAGGKPGACCQPNEEAPEDE